MELLARKLIGTLESMERLPLFLYDSPGGSGLGLQLLTRKIRLRLQLRLTASGKSELVDHSGRQLKAEPLATVGQLHNHLLRMVAKQWYDYPRAAAAFFSQIKEAVAHERSIDLSAYEQAASFHSSD